MRRTNPRWTCVTAASPTCWTCPASVGTGGGGRGERGNFLICPGRAGAAAGPGHGGAGPTHCRLLPRWCWSCPSLFSPVLSWGFGHRGLGQRFVGRGIALLAAATSPGASRECARESPCAAAPGRPRWGAATAVRGPHHLCPCPLCNPGCSPPLAAVILAPE